MLSTTSHPSFQTPIEKEIDGKTVNVELLMFELLDTDQTLMTIATSHRLSLAQLIVWCEQPAIQAYIAAADRLAKQRADHAQIEARLSATATLTKHVLMPAQTPRLIDLAGKAARTLYRPAPKPREH